MNVHLIYVLFCISWKRMKGAVSPVFFQSLVGWSQFIPRPDRKPAHCRPSFAPLLRQSVSFQAVIGQQDVNCIDEKEKPKRDGDDTSRAACSHHDPRFRSLTLDAEVQVERGVFHGPSPDDAADHQTAPLGEQGCRCRCPERSVEFVFQRIWRKG